MGQGFNRVLFIRVDDKLLEELDRLVKRIQKKYPYRRVSRSSAVRAALWFALKHEKELT